MAYDGSVKISTELDKTGLDKGLSGLGSYAEKGFGVLKSAASSAAKIATGAIAGVSAALGAGATAVINVGSSFEEEMSKVSAISGATGDDLNALTEKAKEMGAKTKFSASESAQAMEYMAMAGWETTDMLDGIEGIMNLAAASGEDLASTSDIVTDALTAFGLEAVDAEGFANVLAAASSSANTNVSMMGETFKYVAPVAGALGYSVEDAATAISLMANSGIKAGQAGTSLRAMLTRLAKPTDDVALAMDQMGISLTNSDGSMKSLDEVMRDLRKSFSGLSEAEKTNMAATLAGQEAMSGLLAIVNASDEDFQSLQDSIYNCDGAAADMAATMQENLQGQITILKSSLEGLGIEIYESVQEPLTGLAKTGIEAVNELTEAFKTGGTEGLIEAGAKLVSDLLIGVANTLPEIINTAATIIQTTADNLNANMPQIVAAGGQILMSLGNGIISVIGSLGTLAYGIVTSLVSYIVQQAPTLISGGMQILSQIISGITQTMPNLLQQASDMLTQFLSTVSVRFPEIVQSGSNIITEFVSGLLAKIPDVISQASEMTTGWLETVLDVLPSIVDAGKEMIVNLLSALLDNAPDIITQAGKMLADWTGAILKRFPDIMESGKEMIMELGKALVSNAPEIIAQAGKMLVDYAYEIATHLPEILQKGTEIILELLTGLLKGIPELIGSIPGMLSDIGNEFLNKDWGSVGTNIINGIKNGIANAAGGLVDAAVNAAKSAIDTVKRWLGIHSPSKRARDEIGVNMIAGIGEGVEEETPYLEDTSETSARSAVIAMKNGVASEFVGQMQEEAYRRSSDNEMAARAKWKNNGYDPDKPDNDHEINVYNQFNVDGKPLVNETVRKTKKEIEKEQRSDKAVKGDVVFG